MLDARVAAPVARDRWPTPRLVDATAPVERTRVEVSLLGRFGVVVDGRRVERWTGGTGRLVLKYLVLRRDRTLTRDVLADLFWPDAPPSVARNRLNVTLHGVRRDLRAVSATPIVVHVDGAYRLNPDVAMTVDTDRFLGHVAAARTASSVGDHDGAIQQLEAAVAAYPGDLLDDTPYVEWAVIERERFRIAHLDALEQLAQLRFDRGDHEEAAETCRVLLAMDLIREDVHRLLMRTYARLNRPHLAIHQFRMCARLVRAELGAEPAPETVRLCEAIQRQRPV